MVKLNKRKVDWFIREFEKGELSKLQIARHLGVTRQWLNRLFCEYKRTGVLPVPGKPGRTPQPVSQAEMDLIASFKEEYGCGATGLEKIMREKKVPLPHNIKHVKARVKHPQTNGKLERWWQTLVHNTEHFGDLQYAIWFYNNKRPHMSLERSDGTLVTPIQAFKNKKRRK